MQENRFVIHPKRSASFGRPDKTTKTKTADELHASSSRPRMLQLFTSYFELFVTRFAEEVLV